MQETKCNIKFEPLYKSYSDKEVIGMLATINEPPFKKLVGWNAEKDKYWASIATKKNTRIPIDEPGTMVLVKKYKLDVLMHEAYGDVAD